MQWLSWRRSERRLSEVRLSIPVIERECEKGSRQQMLCDLSKAVCKKHVISIDQA
jgi:hypothetical protein